ncbi:dolichyl-diphosphooligosaccharide--protein glycosyltransferase subunit 1 [Pichia californica]|uniref:Dolichyl-diphosphooligosaccharide--protein glycosyltransferase subunit 1 n=1 Tax=Pichia californica TaxID=460514 RepID=A0A9P6WGV9_9ASCO|nr:dolichyl-diphosphooligosaccharide--protein glycosyltransferase subunit 1 [[Candida] californica]KAG0686905.1 dolichyl-diphosphooligosaccharide--protein glycosyltransferase subunit 1 [[Candida] californica]
MKITQVLYVLFSLVTATLAFHPFEKHWQNSEYEKSVDVSKSFVKERHDINALNIHGKPQSKYVFGLEKSLEFDTSLLLGLYKDTSGKTAMLKSHKLDIYDDDFVYYNIIFPYPIAPGSYFKFSISLILINQMVPYPEHIPMADDQVLKLTTNAYPSSPYDTLAYTLGFISAADFNELINTELPYSLQRNDLSSSVLYKATEPIPGDSILDFSITYTRTAPLTFVNTLVRDLWVSHWSSSLQLEEYYEVTNNGAKLDKGFSRVDYFNEKLMMKPHHAITALRIPFDQSKTIFTDSLYYVDKVGNVSTSQYYEKELIIRPRFPVFGGWNYNFTIGWNSDLKDFLKRENEDTYVLSTHILDGIRDATYQDITLNIYLPEGAELVDYALPFVSDDIKVSHEYSYLDIEKGHLKLTFNFDNIVDEMKNLELVVRYKYSSFNMIEKPLQAAFYIFLALMGLYVLKKIDLSIKPTKNGKLIKEEDEFEEEKKSNVDEIIDVADE